MPKKTATARRGAQRNKPKVQKSVELVRKVSDEQEIEMSVDDVEETPSGGVSVDVDETLPITRKRERASSSNGSSSRKSVESVSGGESVVSEGSSSSGSSGTSSTSPGTLSSAPKGSAAARLVARRQAAHKSQQRAAASMITAEHYAYVVKDLRLIAILAAIMLAIIFILQFVPAIGS